MITLLNRFISTLIIFLIMTYTHAGSPNSWAIVPSESSIIFTATQNDSPVSGQFKRFTGEINFDPSALDTSSVQIIVDTNSLSTSYKEIETTLKTSDWFNVKLFPKAIFKSTQFKKTGDKTYQATGTLNIRDKTVPIILDFTLNEYTLTKARVSGSTLLKRTMFNIGIGEWVRTDEVKDNVKVDFILTTIRK